MNKTMKYFCMAALAMVGAVMTSCSSDDSMTDTLQQPASNVVDKVETLTVSVSLNGDGATRALDVDGNKTFAKGDQIAVVYTNTNGANGETVKAVSDPLKAEDIKDGTSASFTVEITNADKTKDVTYIYPAAMAKDDGSANYEALANQDGTLATIGKELDYSYFKGEWKNDGHLPSGELVNQLAICAFDLKNAQGSIINSTVNSMTINDGTYTYTINRTETSGDPIYVAIKPVTSGEISYTATTAGAKIYLKLAKFSPSKVYEAGSLYPIGLKMAEVVKGKFSVSGSKQVYFSPGNLQATYNGSAWNWHFAANQWDKVGDNEANNRITGNKTVSTNGTVDLFGWSTINTYLGINNSSNNDDYSGDFIDWGSHADVTNTIGTGYRTLTLAEWDYLLNTRTTTSTHRYCKAKVNDVYGVILLPDDWKESYYTLKQCDSGNTHLYFNDNLPNKITLSVWNNSFAPHGAVFLPTTGQRDEENSRIDAPNGRLYYWSSTIGPNTISAYRLYISGNEVSTNVEGGRSYGYAVRLVYDVQQ